MKFFDDKHKVLIFLFVFSLLISGKSLSDMKEVYKSAGISTEQLHKVDSQIRSLIYTGLTKNFNSIKTTKPVMGNPVIWEKNNENFISVFIKSSNPQITQTEVESKGGKVSNTIKDILIVDLPIAKLTDIIFTENINRVEASLYQESLLDTSLMYINVDDVHEGVDLPKAYKGEDVIIGVVDSGIDWEHPAFSNDSGSRILYLWDMSDDTSPPAEFDYGTEYTKDDLDKENSNQVDDHGHGTHVASTAAGNAGGEVYPLDGVAPEADIVFVKGFRFGPGFAQTDVVNGCNYIFQKADQLDKPAVINLSLGGLVGNTGKSLYEESLTNLVEPGRLIAAAAGNEGSTNLHLQYQMSGSTIDERSNTYWHVTDRSKSPTTIYGYPESEDYYFGVQVLNEEDTSVYISPSVGYNEQYQEAIMIDQDTLAILTLDGVPSSKEPYLFQITVYYLSDSGIKNYDFNLYTFGSAFFNAWIEGGVFNSLSNPDLNLIGGDNFMTIGHPSTAFNVFSVGAFTTKTEWTDIEGNPFSVNATLKDRAHFSSIGPLRDGRIKPDFSAPGHWIAAAYSQDGNIPTEWILTDKIVHLQGTSMSAPHFTGVLALLLEQQPDLTYEEAFEVLKNSAVSDDLTGQVPNNEFGHGRIDVHAALQQLITSVESDDELPREFSISQNYPNPFNPTTNIEYSVASKNHVTIKVYDILGNELTTLVSKTKPSGNYKVSLDGSNLSSGVYFYRINAGNYQEVKKMMLIK